MNMAKNNRNDHALVMGTSMGGLLTAQALSSYFTCVTIIEHDVVNRQLASRRGQPQTRPLHSLLPGGYMTTRNTYSVSGGTLVETKAYDYLITNLGINL